MKLASRFLVAVFLACSFVCLAYAVWLGAPVDDGAIIVKRVSVDRVTIHCVLPFRLKGHVCSVFVKTSNVTTDVYVYSKLPIVNLRSDTVDIGYEGDRDIVLRDQHDAELSRWKPISLR